MKNIHIKNSYNVWKVSDMYNAIKENCYGELNSYNLEKEMNRTYYSMYVEWWLHNIGYYITKPFCFIDAINKINTRCKDVDLEEWK